MTIPEMLVTVFVVSTVWCIAVALIFAPEMMTFVAPLSAAAAGEAGR